MNTILIAGAGQLGSRHLQGVKTSKHELDIWVYDLSEDALKVAEERYNQIEADNKKVHFVTSMDKVPNDIDVAIVASSSKPRASIVKNLLSKRTVKYMVLEKFLFPRLVEYEEIGGLIKEKNVKTWVNCTRRMFESYDYIKSIMNPSKQVDFIFEGGEWGMCCNSIHFIDIFMHITGQHVFSFNIDQLLPVVIDSKRAGYVELLGKEQFTSKNGSRLILSSLPEYNGKSHVIIKNENTVIEFNEGNGEMMVNGNKITFPTHLQSELSGILVDELLSTGSCRLTDYDTSSLYHIGYLSVIAPFINKIKGWTSDACPIT